MNDPDFIDLRNKFLLSVLIIIVFLIPTILLFVNKFDVGSSKIVKKINKKETMLVFITSPDCKKCKKIENILSNNDVKYYKLDASKKFEYQEYLQELSITRKDVVIPTLMYIEEGSLYATLVDITDGEDLNSFIENYGLSN
ncbi:MAG: thioredoxin family protein [Bacilli bacterium]|nr:thioredoxin family protein [Bacilli bacterium]